MINSQENSSFSTTLPIGTIVLFGGPVIPENWLLCNGTAISRKIYSQLFDVIGTLHGPGDHTSTFNLPDLRGRFPLGQQSGFYQGGVSEVTLIEAELPSHTHDKGTLSIVEAGFHTHILQDPGHDHGGKTGDGPAGEGNRGTVSGGGFYDHNRHVHVIPRGVTSISVNATGDHTHNVEGVTGSNGFGKCFPNHESLPNYQLHYLLQEYVALFLIVTTADELLDPRPDHPFLPTDPPPPPPTPHPCAGRQACTASGSGCASYEYCRPCSPSGFACMAG